MSRKKNITLTLGTLVHFRHFKLIVSGIFPWQINMITEIDEPIRVGAVFGADCIGEKKIKPVWFVWKGRQYRIKEITYTWTSKEGRTFIHYFSVTDGQNLYEISYNTETMVWKLIAIEMEG